MNSFINRGYPKASYNISKNGEINANNLTTRIRQDIPDVESGDFSLVYIYYLDGTLFPYPNDKSDVLYIGSTIGQKYNKKISAAFRFVHLRNGQDNKQNITLQTYYNNGEKIKLDIYEVDDCRNTEKQWRYEFLQQYGALPIADGAAYSKDKESFITASNDETIDDQNK